MSDINEIMTRYYANAYGQSQERQQRWWNSLTDEERELVVKHVSDVLAQFLPIANILSEAFKNFGVAIVDWYNTLDPEVKQVMQEIADGKGIDALRK